MTDDAGKPRSEGSTHTHEHATRGGAAQGKHETPMAHDPHAKHDARAKHDAHGENETNPSHDAPERHEHASHNKHAGHRVAVFRDKCWLSLAITIPTLIWRHMLQGVL